jgi:hypothetical protein
MSLTRRAIARSTPPASGHRRDTPRRMSIRHAISSGVVAAALATSFGLSVPSSTKAADSAAPSVPGAVTTSKPSATSVKLSWGKASDNVRVVGYRIYRGPSNAANSALRLIWTTDATTIYTATRLYAGTSYTFGIVAIDAANNKSAMRTKTIKTAGSSDRSKPSAPSSTKAAAFSSSRVDLVWGPSTSKDVAGYQVFRNGTRIARVDPPGSLRYSDNGLAANTTYTYVIRAVDAAGNVSSGTAGSAAKTLPAGARRIARGPYVTKVTGTSAVVSWWTNDPTPGVVSYGTAGPSGKSKTDPAGSTRFHKVAIGGLVPGTAYRYRVGNGGSLGSAVSIFRTAAKKGQSFTFSVIGDFGAGGPGAAQNANRIAAAGTHFLLTVGDNVYPSAGRVDPDFAKWYSDIDQRFFRPFGPALRTQSFFPANGNKEYYSDGDWWRDVPMPGSNNSWYSFDWGDAHVLVIDTEVPFNVGSAQYRFAQADLAANKGDAWRIVVIHRPPYSSSTAPVPTDLVPLFERQNVNLVLSGNSHNYERSYPLLRGKRTSGGVTYIVAGAGGNGFNQFTGSKPAWSAFREDTYYVYLKVGVSKGSLKVQAIRADNGAVADSTTLSP